VYIEGEEENDLLKLGDKLALSDDDLLLDELIERLLLELFDKERDWLLDEDAECEGEVEELLLEDLLKLFEPLREILTELDLLGLLLELLLDEGEREADIDLLIEALSLGVVEELGLLLMEDERDPLGLPVAEMERDGLSDLEEDGLCEILVERLADFDADLDELSELDGEILKLLLEDFEEEVEDDGLTEALFDFEIEELLDDDGLVEAETLLEIEGDLLEEGERLEDLLFEIEEDGDWEAERLGERDAEIDGLYPKIVHSGIWV